MAATAAAVAVATATSAALTEIASSELHQTGLVPVFFGLQSAKPHSKQNREALVGTFEVARHTYNARSNTL